jgi:hypothetical protein
MHGLSARIAIFRLCRRIKSRVLTRGIRASVYWFGAYYIHPKHLAVIVQVQTDREKQQLTSAPVFFDELRSELAAVNYPIEGRDGVGFAVESHETVDREFNGSWYYRFK